MAEVVINQETFSKRAKQLYDTWRVRCDIVRRTISCVPMPQPPDMPHQGPCRLPAGSRALAQEKRSTLWENASALAIPVGSTSDDLRYLKSISLHLWLFGYELPGEQQRRAPCSGACRPMRPLAAAHARGALTLLPRSRSAVMC